MRLEEIKILVLADKLSNLRTTARDYLFMGDEVWQRFNEKDKSQHAWYYLSIAEYLSDLEKFAVYQEYKALCKYVFGLRT